ncbi:hypothetical protein ACFX13_000019 [Malus domestica]
MTGIVGLDVVPNAREVLIELYSKTLKEVQAVPKDEGYRKAVESFTHHRLNVCREEEDWDAIEKKLGCDQVEELIEEARDELTLIGKMIEWDPWAVHDDYECEVIENDTLVPKHVPLHRPVTSSPEFSNLTNLTTLDISRNNSSGHFPVRVSGLQNLIVLDAFSNKKSIKATITLAAIITTKISMS